MNDSFSIISLNVGKPQKVAYRNQSYLTAIDKMPVDGKIYLNRFNLYGDGQADLENHGGTDKAICVYPYEHYTYWEQELKITLERAAFGENLTVQGLTEDKVYIGDIFQFGEAVVQVSQPRKPCYKAAYKLGIENLVVRIQHTGYSGYYLRVLKEGWVSKDTPLQRVETHPKRVSVQLVNLVRYHDTTNKAKIKDILHVHELAESWRIPFAERLREMR